MRGNFYAVVNEAIREFAAHGFDSQARLEQWLARIETSMSATLMPAHELQKRLAQHLTQIFERTVRRPSALMKRHPGVPMFKLQQLAPRLRAELNRRILASVSLITLDQKASRQRALQRLAGWATSIPAGGSKAVDKAQEGELIRRSISGLPHRERVVIIDQGHKLVAAIHDIIAVDGGAIAYIWRHIKQGPPAYDSRPEHVERDGRIFLLRGSWAMKRGFVKLDGHQYYDEVTAVAEEPFCSCWVEPVYGLSELPASMLTLAGKAELARVRKLTA